jgi:Uma2 family endonuclease
MSSDAVQLERTFTYEEYLEFDDGTDYRYELVDGQLVRMTPARGRHGKIARFVFLLLIQLIEQASHDWVARWDIGVRTLANNVRLPDIAIITKEQEDSIDDISAVLDKQPPLLIVEIVSPGKEQLDRDYEDKRQEYQALGVPEYWIVDRDENKVTVLILQGKQYQAQVYVGNQQIVSALFPELELTVDRLLQG